jgi:hypothetical protein
MAKNYADFAVIIPKKTFDGQLAGLVNFNGKRL